MTQERRNPADHLAPYRFQPGQSGNPGGRPRRPSLTALLQEFLDRTEIEGKPIKGGKTIRHLIIEVMAREALKGNHAFHRDIWHRVEGPIAPIPEEADTKGQSIDPERAARMLEAGLDDPGHDPPPDEP